MSGWGRPQGIEAEWAGQPVAEQSRAMKAQRGFARQEWATLQERKEEPAGVALRLVGPDHGGDRFWPQGHAQVANAWVRLGDLPTTGKLAHPSPPPVAPAKQRAHK